MNDDSSEDILSHLIEALNKIMEEKNPIIKDANLLGFIRGLEKGLQAFNKK